MPSIDKDIRELDKHRRQSRSALPVHIGILLAAAGDLWLFARFFTIPPWATPLVVIVFAVTAFPLIGDAINVVCCGRKLRMLVRKKREGLAKRLDRSGFYSYCSNGEKRAAIALAVDEGVFLSDESRRVAMIDPENVYEGLVSEEARRVTDVLSAMGVGVTVEQSETPEGRLWLTLNGRRYRILPPGGGSNAARWKNSAIRLLESFQDTLDALGMDEKVYYNFGSNDTLVALLTPEMHEILGSSGICEWTLVEVGTPSGT